MHRRDFLKGTAAGGTTALAGAATTGCSSVTKRGASPGGVPPFELDELTVAALQARMADGRFTAANLVALYTRRIRELDQSGPALKAVIELNPDAPAIARALDRERTMKGPRGPLHGIPVLLKDNVATRDRMMTTAGSLALLGSIAPRDAFVVERLRAAGAVILGKTNLSEWANFRGYRSISGWSARGGLTRNPYALDRSASGSSSGSAAAVSANLCAVAVGTETDGSIVSPASYCGIVGLKPTVGLVSRAGIIPIAASQDTAGPMARTVADAALLLGAMTGVDERDTATHGSRDRAHTDYTRFLDADALRGARLGVARAHFNLNQTTDAVVLELLEVLARAGAVLVDPVEMPSRRLIGDGETQVMLHEFKAGLNAYLGELGPDAPVKSMADVIAFNEREAATELKWFGQERLLDANSKGPLTETAYLDAKERCGRWTQALEALFAEHQLDAIVAPTNGPAGVLDLVVGDRGLGGSSSYAAVAGWPSITVPCGEVSGLPVGLSFFSRAWTEPKLIGIAHAFEQATRARKPPRFLPTLNLV